MARYLILLLCLLLQPLLASTQSLTSASAPLITLTAAGTFSVNPNRTITIERPSIDPTSTSNLSRIHLLSFPVANHSK